MCRYRFEKGFCKCNHPIKSHYFGHLSCPDCDCMRVQVPENPERMEVKV